jgi:UDP-N-acetylmuramate--alanine ligase
MSLLGASRVHFVGIGGAGMSAIAKVLLEKGVEVSGSDLKRSRAITVLEAMGARVHVGHNAALVTDADVVVMSSAIPASNPELAAAEASDLTILSRGEALAELLAGGRALVVAGTHGKTTTTSMIVSVLRAFGRDPTYLVGAGLNDVGTNARFGRGDLAVAESDESDGTFLLLEPDIAVVTNVDADHLDYWGSLAEIRAGFERFMSRVKQAIVVPAEDDRLVEAARATGTSTVTFGARGDVFATDIRLHADGVGFVLHAQGEAAPVRLRVPGHHNVLNALAAAGASIAAGVPPADIARGLADYTGVERRFQIRGRVQGVTVIDDYAHHPAEVRATLSAARTGPWDRLVAVFQPHRYSRTRALAAQFGSSFADADRVVVTDVYGAGEQPVPGVTGKLVADSVCARLPGRPVAYLPHRAELVDYLAISARPGDALLTLGAGDVTSVGEELLVRLGAHR